MRYKIEINLLALQELNSKISLEEAVLLDYLYWLCSSPSEEVEKMRIEKDGKRYTWFDYGFYIKETPILRGKTKATITPKIKALEEEEFIETFIDENTGRKYIRLLPKCDTLFRKLNAPVKKTKRPPFRKLNIDNNTNKDNNTIDNNAIQGIATPKEEDSLKGSQVNHIISEFKQLNPSYEQFFNNKTQRKAVENLLKKYGEENLVKLIAKVKETNQIKFAPIIVSPLDLQNKLAKLLFFIKQQEKSGRKIGFTF